MLKELFYNEQSEAVVNHNGLVISRYNEIYEGYDFKIIADVAVVNYGDGLRVFGAADDTDGTELWCNINELVANDEVIEIIVVDDSYRLPEGETVISPYPIKDREVATWAIVPYGGQQPPVVYIKYTNFDEDSYKELVDFISKLYIL